MRRMKRREGVIERLGKDGRTAVCRGMFKKETDISLFAGMQVWGGPRRPAPACFREAVHQKYGKLMSSVSVVGMAEDYLVPVQISARMRLRTRFAI